MSQLHCQCGAPLQRPIQPHCPACGAVIRGVRRRRFAPLAGGLAAVVMLAAVVVYALWLAGVFR